MPSAGSRRFGTETTCRQLYRRAVQTLVCYPGHRCSALLNQPNSNGVALGSSVLLAREDECRAGHDRRAGHNERHADILDLTRAGATGGLESALDDVPQTVNAARAQAATKRVQRQLAVEPDPTALDEVERLALLAEAVGLEAVYH